MRNPFKRRTRPLTTGKTLEKSLRARERRLNNPEALEHRRCETCGGFKNINGECRKCQ